MHGASWVETHHRTGTSHHPMLSAALVHPAKREVMPLMPEPIITHDGADKNHCERTAAKRLLATLRQDHPHLQVLVTEDSLRSNAPHIAVVPDHPLPSLVGVQEGDPASWCAHVAAAERDGRVLADDREDAKTGLRHRFRFVRNGPLKEATGDLRGHLWEGWEWHRDQVPHCSWVTALRVNPGTVSQLIRGGRARWRIAQETCKTLKTQGDHCEPNDGHGYQHLSVRFAVLRMLALVVD